MRETDELPRAPRETSRPTWLGAIGGPCASMLVYAALWRGAPDLEPSGRAAASMAAWMAVWWMTEAVPLPVTSLLPLIAVPLLGIGSTEKAAAPYADKNIFLFMGGFLIALAAERWNLHRRFALLTLLAVGTRPRQLVGGVMLATGALSMWMSNTATTAMMLPIGMSLVALVKERWASVRMECADEQAEREQQTGRFAACMMLCIAYAASIGGMGTLVGTPTNLFLAGFLQNKGSPISFIQWMAFAMPLAFTYLAAAWWLLTHWIFPIRLAELPGGHEVIQAELSRLGRVSRGEWTVLIVFGLVALCWVFRPLLAGPVAGATGFTMLARLDDTVIAMAGALVLFVIPVDRGRGQFAMDWATAMRLPWGVLILFGGGFSLAEAIASSHLADWIGAQIAAFQGIPVAALVVVVTAMILMLTELTSNTPTAAAFLPILHGVAEGMGFPPMVLLVPATLAASCAFMLPVATPPNAIVFGSGHIAMRDMIRAGMWLNLLGLLLIPTFVLSFGNLVLSTAR